MRDEDRSMSKCEEREKKRRLNSDKRDSKLIIGQFRLLNPNKSSKEVGPLHQNKLGHLKQLSYRLKYHLGNLDQQEASKRQLQSSPNFNRSQEHLLNLL